MLGYTAEEYIGRNIKEFHVDPPVIEDILCRLTNNETLEHYESRLRCKDGSIRHVAINSSVYRRNGQFVHTRCFTHDITAEKARVEIQELLSAIVHSSEDAIISKDLNGVITSWNKTAERLFGYSADEAIGQTVAALLIPEDRQDEEPEILAKLRRGERVDHFHTKRRRKDGGLLDISLTISPVKDSRGKIVGASKIARDITEMVKVQEALRDANDSLKRSNADLEHFAYSASHDLQEPLRMVSTYAELVAKKYSPRLDEDAQTYLAHVIEGGARMQRLLRGLRAYTQVSLANNGPEADVESRPILDSVLAGLADAIEESGAVIDIGDLPPVSIHEFQLEQLFQNIIGNALRYRSERKPSIRISAEREGRFWKFSIEDNGIGINQEYKEQIFGLFTRLHAASEYPGTGMGLAICQRIVERSRGRIWVESEPGVGSTFHFLLPGRTDQ
jgi:PAS domain S-box-containing protein